MKWLKIIGHPALMMSLYLILLMESEHFGGFYLLYLLMALPGGASFAIFSLIGLVAVFVGYKVSRHKLTVIKPILYLAGYVVMILGLMLFFARPDRLDTFQLVIPIISFVVFGISSVCFLIYSISLFPGLNKNGNELNVVH